MVMSTDLLQQREQILRQMQNIHRLRRGSFSHQSFPGKNINRPDHGPYFLLQGYSQGRKFSERIPADRAAQVEEDVANYRRFQQLAEQFIAVSDALTREEMPIVKRGRLKREMRKANRRMILEVRDAEAAEMRDDSENAERGMQIKED